MGLAWTAGRVLKAEQPFCVIGYLDLRCLASRSSGDSIFPSSHYELSQARCDDLSRDGDQRGSRRATCWLMFPGMLTDGCDGLPNAEPGREWR